MTFLNNKHHTSSTSSVFICSSVTPCTDSSSAIATTNSKRSMMPESVVMMRLSPATEVAIRLMPGNDRCVDCKAIFPQWAGVSFGILLCLVCAGKHRSLGVQTSFVKSLVMDVWSASEVCALELGGNAKWAAVCAETGISDLAMLKNYTSDVAKSYKSRVLMAAVRKSLAECSFAPASILEFPADVASLSDENSSSKEDLALSATIATKAECRSDHVDNTTVKCTMCSVMVALDELNFHSRSCTISALPAVGWIQYERRIGAADEPLGFTVAKAGSGYAEVCRINPGSAADRANVIVGSLLIGLNNETSLKFHKIVSMLRTLPRPILFHFVFRSHVSREGLKATISSVPELRTVEVNVTLHDNEELGCSLSASGLYCVVRSVDEDECIARRHGVLVGSRIVAINGQKCLNPKDYIRNICTAQRPIKITVHRVEGLIRGCSS